MSVQLFKINEKYERQCIQRLGGPSQGAQMNQFYGVYGIWVLHNRMYVSDVENSRIQIFET